MFDIRTSKRVYYLVAKDEEEMNKWVDCICSVCGLKMEAIQNELALLPPITPSAPPPESNDERYSPQPNQNDSLSRQSPSLQTVLSFPSLNSSTGTVSTNVPTTPSAPIDDSVHSFVVPQTSQQPSPPITISSSDSSRSSLAASSSLNYIPISECYTGKSENEPEKPPPRPPKPRTLQSGPKSQSSLALYSQDQSPQHGVTPVPPAPVRKIKPPPVPSSGYEFVSPNTTNIATVNGQNSFPLSDTVMKSCGPQLMPKPPAVNRDLKPQRCHNNHSSHEQNVM